MATIVNNPAPVSESNNGTGMIIGVLLFLGFLFLFVMYGLPALSRMQTPQINIPNKIDVNIKQTN